MKNMKTWLVLALGIGALAVLSGAFERFIGWDRSKSAAMNGILTIGLAVGGAYLAHSAGIIDGNTRNTVITAGAAIGAFQIAGNKLYEFGSDIAGRFKGAGPAAPQSKPSSNPSGALTPPTSGIGITGAVPTGGIAPPSFASQAAAPGPAPTATAPAGAAPVYHVTVEAPKAVKPDLGTTIAQGAFSALGQIGAAWAGGSKGSASDRLVLGGL